MTSVIPEPVMDLLHLLRDNGIAAFVVGGAVRDMCQERPPEDVDILAHASIDVLKTLFKGRPVRVVGNTFPVCLVNDIEVVPCRAASGRFPEDDLPCGISRSMPWHMILWTTGWRTRMAAGETWKGASFALQAIPPPGSRKIRCA